MSSEASSESPFHLEPGKSRKDLLPKLIRFLMEQPIERLQVHINSAPTVSEEQRQQGFSVLTDKLLRGG